jgi:hypothetical protein
MDESVRNGHLMIGIICTTDLQKLRNELFKTLNDYRNKNGEVKYHEIDQEVRPIVFYKIASRIEKCKDFNCFITGLNIDTDPPKDPYSAFAATIIGHILEWVYDKVYDKKGVNESVPAIRFIIDPTTSLDPGEFKRNAKLYAGNIIVNDPPPIPTRDCEIWAADIVAGALIDIFVNKHPGMKGSFNKLIDEGLAANPKLPSRLRK